MQIIDLETGAPQDKVAPLSIALGTFDGIHIGHMALIKECRSCPKETQSAVFTFRQNPFGVPYIYSLEEKLNLLKELGVKYACLCDFDKIKDMDPATFENEILFGKLNAKKIVCGYDFHYGAEAKGNITTLKEACEKHDVAFEVIDKVMLNKETVSSSLIRGLLCEGNIAKANKLLGRAYSLTAEVTHGNELGSKNGYPTINQPIEDKRCKLRRGVYASRVLGHNAMSDIGYKPTIGSNRLLCETNIFDFDCNLYGKTIKTELIDFVRDETEFESIEKLFERLSVDKQICTEKLKKYEK